MSINATINYVTTEDKFIPPEPLFSYTYPPPPGRPQTNERYDPQLATIHDIREHPELNFESVGFQVVTSPTEIGENHFEGFSSNTDRFEPLGPEEVALRDYHDEIEACIRQVIPNVTKVITYNQKTRKHTPKTTVEGYDFSSVVNYPVPHIDLVPKSAAELLEPYTNGAKRVLIVNAWRPIRGTVLDAPLAVADPRTVPQQSKIYNRVIYPDREKGMYMIRNSPNTNTTIKWYYLSSQTPSEVLLFKQYDSLQPDDIPPHSAFVDERYEGKEGVEPRWSIETRSLVLVD